MNGSEPSYGLFLCQLGDADPRVVVIDAGLATSMQTAVFREAWPRRYFNLGIAEQNAVGVASGLARRGFVPLVHSFSNFLARRAHDQIAVSVAWPGCQVKFIAGSCGVFDGRNGPSHMAVDDLAAMSALPGMMVAEPGDLEQTRDLLHAIVKYPGPAYLRVRRHNAPRSLLPGTTGAMGTVVVQQRAEARVTLVVGGSLLSEGLQAVRMLGDRGLSVELVHVTILRPLDGEPIVASARRTGVVVTLENHVMTGGFGDGVARVVGDLGVRIVRLALPDVFVPAGDPAWQLAYCGLDAHSVVQRIQRVAEGR